MSSELPKLSLFLKQRLCCTECIESRPNVAQLQLRPSSQTYQLFASRLQKLVRDIFNNLVYHIIDHKNSELQTILTYKQFHIEKFSNFLELNPDATHEEYFKQFNEDSEMPPLISNLTMKEIKAAFERTWSSIRNIETFPAQIKCFHTYFDIMKRVKSLSLLEDENSRCIRIGQAQEYFQLLISTTPPIKFSLSEFHVSGELLLADKDSERGTKRVHQFIAMFDSLDNLFKEMMINDSTIVNFIEKFFQVYDVVHIFRLVFAQEGWTDRTIKDLNFIATDCLYRLDCALPSYTSETPTSILLPRLTSSHSTSPSSNSSLVTKSSVNPIDSKLCSAIFNSQPHTKQAKSVKNKKRKERKKLQKLETAINNVASSTLNTADSVGPTLSPTVNFLHSTEKAEGIVNNAEVEITNSEHDPPLPALIDASDEDSEDSDASPYQFSTTKLPPRENLIDATTYYNELRAALFSTT